jgi:hypothetical protein
MEGSRRGIGEEEWQKKEEWKAAGRMAEVGRN